jgi:hypothetical protein
MKRYKYAVFLRHPVTKDVQHGTIEFDADGEYMDFSELVRKLNMEQNICKFNEGHTLIGLNIVSVEEI